MMWVLLGMIAGGAWLLAAQQLPWVAGPLDALTSALADAGTGTTEAAFRALGLGAQTPLVHVAGAIAAAVAPGLVCLLVAEAVVTSRAARSAAATLLTLTAFGSFFWLPGPEALALLVAALVLTALLAVGHGLLLTVPVTATVTALTGRLVLDVTHGGHRFTESAQTLAEVAGTVGLWRAALAVVALTTMFAAIRMLARRP